MTSGCVSRSATWGRTWRAQPRAPSSILAPVVGKLPAPGGFAACRPGNSGCVQGLIDLRGRRAARGPRQVLADPSGTRARILRPLAIATAAALTLWLIGIVAA